MARKNQAKECNKCGSTRVLIDKPYCRQCYNDYMRQKQRMYAQRKKEKNAGLPPKPKEIKDRQCAGCRIDITSVTSYCTKCATARQSKNNNGWAQYNQVSWQQRREILEFIRRIRLKNYMVGLYEIVWIIEYFQVISKLIYSYDTKRTGEQIKEMWLDLLIWEEKQINPKATYYRRTRADEYKRLSK